jgi:hypothetical protein
LAPNWLEKKGKELQLHHGMELTNIAQYKRYLLREVSRYPAIKEWKRKHIVAHALGDFDLRKLGQPLTEKDKAVLRLSYKKPVTTEMIALVEPAFIPFFDIDEALSLIMSNARRKHQLHCDWDRLIKNSDTRSIELQTPADELTCKWCTAHSQKTLKKSFNLPKNIQYHCNCVWFRGAVIAQQASPRNEIIATRPS